MNDFTDEDEWFLLLLQLAAQASEFEPVETKSEEDHYLAEVDNIENLLHSSAEEADLSTAWVWCDDCRKFHPI